VLLLSGWIVFSIRLTGQASGLLLKTPEYPVRKGGVGPAFFLLGMVREKFMVLPLFSTVKAAGPPQSPADT